MCVLHSLFFLTFKECSQLFRKRAKRTESFHTSTRPIPSTFWSPRAIVSHLGTGRQPLHGTRGSVSLLPHRYQLGLGRRICGRWMCDLPAVVPRRARPASLSSHCRHFFFFFFGARVRRRRRGRPNASWILKVSMADMNSERSFLCCTLCPLETLLQKNRIVVPRPRELPKRPGCIDLPLLGCLR